jgi:hypothetical protein
LPFEATIRGIYIAKKEASETKYWLAIIVKLTGDSDELIAVSEATQKKDAA